MQNNLKPFVQICNSLTCHYDLCKKIKKMQCLSKLLQKLVVKRGAYYSHHENLFVSIINVDNSPSSELGFRNILKVRKKEEKIREIRT